MVARLRDVAELAGVSVKTASNVLNNYPHIKPTTRARVEAAMAELHYRPNISARNLKHGRAGFLALAVPAMDSPYFAQLAAIITARASDLGYILLLDSTRASADAERIVLNGVRSHVIDGVIFSPLALSAQEIKDRADDLPMVLLGERAIPTGIDHVGADSVRAADAVTQHLIDLGRDRVAAIGLERSQGTASVRLRGYKRALKKAGVPFEPALGIRVSHWERADGYQAMQTLLALPKPPDAVFCFNDLLAFGAMRACVEAGVRIPEDIAIAGFDNVAETAYSNPTLTTVAVDLATLADEALRLLIARIDGSADPVEQLKVPWQIKIRESTVGRDARPNHG